jgi:hypothetical protein
MSGKPTFVPDDAMRARVRSLAAAGATWELIARKIGWSEKVARRKLSVEYQQGIDEANVSVAGKLYQMAMAGNVPCMLFWMKCRGHWREVHPVDEKQGNEAQRIAVSFELPTASDTPPTACPAS